jgi:hypothetical protein
MKKLIYISVATLAFAIPGVAFADNSSDIEDRDFKQLVCSSLEGSDNKVESLTQVLSMTQSVITPQQKQTLVQLANDDMNSQSYCQDVDL